MKKLFGFSIIIFIAFIGEILNKYLPFPIPASIYGLIILFICLQLKIVPYDFIKEPAHYLLEIMPIMFVPGAVGIMEQWGIIKPNLLPIVVSLFIAMVVMFVLIGKIVEFATRKEK